MNEVNFAFLSRFQPARKLLQGKKHTRGVVVGNAKATVFQDHRVGGAPQPVVGGPFVWLRPPRYPLDWQPVVELSKAKVAVQ